MVYPVTLGTGATSTRLEGVSCPSSTACTAVGYHENYHEGKSEGPLALAESWNGTEWKTQSALNPEGAMGSQLGGISCSSTTSCIAVGYYKNSSDDIMTLAESWNGTEWKIQSTPNPGASTESRLSGLSCSSTTSCIAVGYYKNSSDDIMTLAESWNGTEWKIQSTPNPGAEESWFNGVSCWSSTECVAAGAYGVPTGSYLEGRSINTETALAESWNGAEWKVEPTLTPNMEISRKSNFNAVSCWSQPGCIAMGSLEFAPLPERYTPPPAAITEAATSVGAAGATLDGTVNPNDLETNTILNTDIPRRMARKLPKSV